MTRHQALAPEHGEFLQFAYPPDLPVAGAVDADFDTAVTVVKQECAPLDRTRPTQQHAWITKPYLATVAQRGNTFRVAHRYYDRVRHGVRMARIYKRKQTVQHPGVCSHSALLVSLEYRAR